MKEHKIQILNELKNNLSIQLKDNLKDVILFGSQLYENENTDSDYDILIIIKKKPDWKLEREISDICYEIDLKYGIITDTHILSDKEMSLPRGKQPIFHNAINQGYHV